MVRRFIRHSTVEKKKPIKILLFYAWGNENAGDKALALGTVESIRQCFPSSRIDIVSIIDKRNDAFETSRKYIADRYPDVRMLPNDLLLGHKLGDSKIFKLFRKILLIFGLCCPLILKYVYKHSSVFTALLGTDIVLLNGGHLLFWSDRMGQKQKIMKRYVLPLLLARRLSKRYVLHAQSFGPFEFNKRNCLFYLIFRHILCGANAVSVRDSASLSHLKICMGCTDTVRCVLDSGFFLTGRDDSNASLILKRYSLKYKKFLAITVRLSKRGSQKELDAELYESYANKIREFIALWTSNKSIPIAFICQVTKDVEDTGFILSKLSQEQKKKCVVIKDDPSPELLIALYANAIALVGMRFHSLVFALQANTPVIGLYYYDIGPKIKGIMRDLGYPEYAFCIDNISGNRLYDSASNLLKEAHGLSKKLEDRVSFLREASLDILMNEIGVKEN